MAVTSNVKKFTIRHKQESVDAAYELRRYPSGVSPSHNMQKVTFRNMYGQYHGVCVNSALKFIWKWNFIEESDLIEIWKTHIYDKIIQYKDDIFIINTYFPGLGWVEAECYLGSPNQFDGKAFPYDGPGSTKLTSFEIHWIEKDGIILNSPAALASQTGTSVNLSKG